VLSGMASDQRRLHTLFSRRRRKVQKRPEMPWGDHFKPIQTDLGGVMNAACNYTKWPEVKAGRAVGPLASPRPSTKSASMLQVPATDRTSGPRPAGVVLHVDDSFPRAAPGPGRRPTHLLGMLSVPDSVAALTLTELDVQ
jgi:hypothetical protein